jgi:hypothetical protein
MRDADDPLVGTVMLLEDITHLGEIDRLKSEFIAGVPRTPDAAHERSVQERDRQLQPSPADGRNPAMSRSSTGPCRVTPAPGLGERGHS